MTEQTALPVRRVAAYARYSRAKDHEAITIEAQVNQIRAYVERQGWVLVRSYKDEEVPGKTPPEERAGLTELLDDMAAKKFDVVMSLDDSRLARSNPIFWNLIERFRGAKVTYKMLIFPEIDSDRDEFDSFAATLQGGNTYVSRRTSRITKTGLEELKAQGFATNHAPRGFKLVPADPTNPKSHRIVTPDELGRRAIDFLSGYPRNRKGSIKVSGKLVAEEFGLTLDQAYKLIRAVEKYGESLSRSPKGESSRVLG